MSQAGNDPDLYEGNCSVPYAPNMDNVKGPQSPLRNKLLVGAYPARSVV